MRAGAPIPEHALCNRQSALWRAFLARLKGKSGKEYYGMKFKADVLEKEKDYYVIEFQKESAPDLVHDTSYWESSTINFLY